VIDPRPAILRKRLSRIGRILAFCSAKGGVGKSVCAAASALVLRDLGRRAGLLDLDFQGSTAHLLLGAPPGFPEELAGLKPRSVAGVQLMSIALFSGERPVPLRGIEVTEAFLELLAVTVWDELDFLVIDLPPGIGDEVLDLLRFLDRAEYLVLSTPSRLSIGVVGRLLALFQELRVPVRGLIETMAPAGGAMPVADDAGPVRGLACRYHLDYLGAVPYVPNLDEAIGSPPALLAGGVGQALRRILPAVL
jgi:ATP-binding protein involved in chromosome partitioning